MALAHTSDDSLRQILSFLMGQDVIRLVTTGSKRFMARVARNITHLEWRFSRPAHFPSFSFAFANLKSLTINSLGRYGHVSLHGYSPLPLEPMTSLESLDLTFSTSHLVFTAPSSDGGATLSSSFPKLTYLAVHANTSCALPHGWTESLPQGLLHLTLDIWNIDEEDSSVDPSLIDTLPLGLQHLQFGGMCPVGPGDANLLRFPDLRVLRVEEAHSWDILKSLPDSLEELVVRCWNDNLPTETFPLSKLPPKIRTLKLTGERLALNFDTKAPHTIEELELALDHDIQARELEAFFYTKNLRALQGVNSLIPGSLSMFPSVKKLEKLGGVSAALDTLEIIPRKLESLFLNDSMRPSPSVSFKNLPPSLETFRGFLLSAEDISELPRALSSVRLERSNHSPTLKVPAEVWSGLPPQLKRLEVQMRLFESESCLHALPETIQTLSLDVNELLEHVTFPKSLKNSLEKLDIYNFCDARFSRRVEAKMAKPVLSQLSEFSRLSSIRIALHIRISSNTLDYLPKTLLDIRLESAEFTNFGLPREQSPEGNCDWKDGALSRLPEGLESLDLHFMEAPHDSIDFNLFSNLPPRLVSLYIYTSEKICDSPKKFIASLPRRLSYLLYSFVREESLDGEERGQTDTERELDEAVSEYYSDPFWDGQQYALVSL